MSDNIVQILESNAERFPEKKGIIHGDEEITYGELLSNVRRRAAYFTRRGIGKGDGVLIVVPMSIALYEILIALFHIGAVALFVDAWADRSRLELARKAFPIKGFVGVGRAHLMRLLSPALRSIPIKLGARLPRRWDREIVQPVDVSSADPALITFTTGSTGLPKGANRTHGFLLSQHRALRRHLDPSPADVDMATLPIFPLSNLALGATTLLPDIDFRNVGDFDPASVAKEIDTHGVTTSAGSPAFFTRLASACLSEGLTLPSLRHLAVGGAAVYPATARLLREAFPSARISVVYGSTEAEPISTIDAEELIETALLAPERGLPVGVPVDSIRLRILSIDGDREDEAIDAPGEICVTGEHVLKDYVGDPAQWREKFIEIEGETWLRTGDAGRLDSEGSLYLLGRVQNSWIGDGRRIFSLPAEMTLEGVEGVRIGTVLNVAGETIVFAETDRIDDETADRIGTTLNAHGLKFDRVVQLRKIPRDPRHASKIDYRALSREQ